MSRANKIMAFSGKYGEIVVHLCLLLLYFSALNVYWTKDWTDWELHKTTVPPFSALAFPVAFYLNALWFIPRYLNRRRWMTYGTLLVLSALLLEGIRSALFWWLDGGDHTGFGTTFRREFLGYKHGLGAISNGFLLSLAYRFARDWVRNLSLIEKLKADKLSADLAFLKSQVDPHFLFNTLNSLYAMALEEKAGNTADGIAQLGTLMRYNLHDSRAAFIPLEKEIDYIKKYIALQRLRMTGKTQVDFEVQLQEGEERNIRIAPMLLIPFVENAFKYGLSPVLETRIRIDIRLDRTILILNADNTIAVQPAATREGGVGLENVSNRLTLLYPERHVLVTQALDGVFSVRLELDLAE